jgi:hypothetical protein
LRWLKKIYKYLTSHKIFNWLLAFIFIANLADGLLTIIWLEHRVAMEANPLMAELYAFSPVFFMFAKVTIVLLALAGLYKASNRMTARILIWPVFFIYLYVLIWHGIGAIEVAHQVAILQM